MIDSDRRTLVPELTSLLPIRNPEALEKALAVPTPALIAEMGTMHGRLVVLGAGGKMGPSLAALAAAAGRAAGSELEVVAVSRFGQEAVAERLRAAGVRVHRADLLDEPQVAALPEADYIVYMVGYKFGASQQPPLVWAINGYLPARLAERYRTARWVAFSTGNVYPLSSLLAGGATETTPPAPVGEYAQSCLARERILEYFAERYAIPMTILRLNYAVELRYGVLLDVAQRVRQQHPIDLRMGHVNVIWQGDANAWALQSFRYGGVPPTVLNITGPETVSVRWLAEEFGRRLGIAPRFINQEAPDALLSNASKAHALFGYPRLSLGQLIEAVAEWVQAGLPTLGKPTHFEEREGQF